MLGSSDSQTSSQARLIERCIKYLQSAYQQIYGDYASDSFQLIKTSCELTLPTIAKSDAAYHNLEHTIAVVLVGQEILRGKCLWPEPVSPADWLHYIISLLCHDIGYVKGACQGDRPDQMTFITGKTTTGQEDSWVQLSATATSASLTPYHVDRGKQFVAETFQDHPLLDIARLQLHIELTRFPVPKVPLYQDMIGYPGLTRTADLIGQLSDPKYLNKLPALFQEFEEIGGNKALGYQTPKDLRSGYPKFYWYVVHPYVRHGMRYLEVSQEGRAILDTLYNNLKTVENEVVIAAA